MARRILVPLLELLAVLFLVSVGVFLLLALVPGDPAVAVLGEGRTPQEYEQLREQLGLNDPMLVRYGDWLGGVLTGDLGTSLVPPQTSVLDRIVSALPVSLELAVLGLALALLIAVPLAMWSAYYQGGRVDRAVSVATFALLSMPSFLIGLLLIAVLVNALGLFPRNEWVRPGDGIAQNLAHAFLPALTIALMEAAMFTRILRADLVTTLREDFILAARARGMSPIRIMLSDALRPSSFSLVTVLGLSIGRLVGSTVIVEYLFSLPGMGKLVIDAANQGNYPVVQGAVLVIAVIYVASNALIDRSYGLLDPRTRRAHV
ncbi:ABC transporter permease [Nocardioides sp. zg-536]|uniref:ABC transporter permease n=1 Tax=Nocardioides faecalis TaxID=2803858 RepID=A0A939BSY9_9ACTN|nr:ABC transporter permease [Nocardioides faecalis]MBM9460119.1 ABC transporter permease [Nocardioides faecalis]MBS4754218.1 ABC transporter permease [Nocardioides faecalis]QVI60088.1 ABC transporter permease [Nocardioides faecalis]